MSRLDKAFRLWGLGGVSGQIGSYSYGKWCLFQNSIAIASRWRFEQEEVIFVREDYMGNKIDSRLNPEIHFRDKLWVTVNSNDFAQLFRRFRRIEYLRGRVVNHGWKHLLASNYNECGQHLSDIEAITSRNGLSIPVCNPEWLQGSLVRAGACYLLRGKARAICYNAAKWTKPYSGGRPIRSLTSLITDNEWMIFQSLENAVVAKLSQPPGIDFKLYEIPR